MPPAGGPTHCFYSVTMFVFVLDAQSGVPTYVQLIQQVKNGIRMGLLRPGDRLPTAKEVVGALAINPNTVLKAYRELEREGLVAPRPGAGTFIRKGLGVGLTGEPGPAVRGAAVVDGAGQGRRS